MKSFMDFIKQVGVLGIVVGFALGQGLYRLVESLVLYVFDPLLAALFDVDNINQLYSTLDDSFVQWGVPLILAINLVVLFFVVMLVVKGLTGDKKASKTTAAKTTSKSTSKKSATKKTTKK